MLYHLDIVRCALILTWFAVSMKPHVIFPVIFTSVSSVSKIEQTYPVLEVLEQVHMFLLHQPQQRNVPISPSGPSLRT